VCDGGEAEGSAQRERRANAAFGDRQAVRRPGALIALAVGAYVVLAVLAYWPVLPSTQQAAAPLRGRRWGSGADVVVPCLDTVRSRARSEPIFHQLRRFPLGVNLASNTSVPLLGILSAPVTLALGPVASFNLLMRIALAGSALRCSSFREDG